MGQIARTSRKSRRQRQREALCGPCAEHEALTCPELAEKIAEMDEVGERGGLASDVYDRYDPNRPAGTPPSPPPPGYTRVSDDPETLRELFPGRSDEEIKEMFEPEDSSFRAALYQDEQGKSFLVFRGTTVKADNVSNLSQGLGHEAAHYEKAKKLTGQLRRSVGAPNMELVGHSLGGGMATAASAISGIKATVFNPAGVHPNTVGGADLGEAPTTAYVVEGENLNWVQDNRVASILAVSPFAGIALSAYALIRGGLPAASGRRVSLPPVNSEGKTGILYDAVGRRLDLHSMEAVKQSVAQQKQTLHDISESKGCPEMTPP